MICFCRWLLILTMLMVAPAYADDAGYDLDAVIQPLPLAAVKWHDSRSFGQNKVYEMYRAVRALPDGRVVVAGQGGSDLKGVSNAGVVTAYDAAGQVLWHYVSTEQGYHQYYDIMPWQDDTLLVFGNFSAESEDEEENWSGAVPLDDQLSFTILATADGAVLHHQKISHEAGSLYSPHVHIDEQGHIYIKALLRGADMQEKTQLYALNLAKTAEGYDAAFIPLAQFVGRSYALDARDGALTLAGSADAAQLYSYNRDAGLKQLYNADARQSNFAGLMITDQGYMLSGEVMGDHIRNGQMLLLDYELKALWAKVITAQEPSFIGGRNIIPLSADIFAALFYIEPRNPELAQYSALLIGKNDGTFCAAYRLGHVDAENYIAGAITADAGHIWIVGARADRSAIAPAAGRSGSALQNARFLAYNTDIMALDMAQLNTCQ